MLTPKQEANNNIVTVEDEIAALQAKARALQLEAAVTYPIDHDAIKDLIKDLSKEEIAAIPYLPNRAEYLKR